MGLYFSLRALASALITRMDRHTHTNTKGGSRFILEVEVLESWFDAFRWFKRKPYSHCFVGEPAPDVKYRGVPERVWLSRIENDEKWWHLRRTKGKHWRSSAKDHSGDLTRAAQFMYCVLDWRYKSFIGRRTLISWCIYSLSRRAVRNVRLHFPN